MAIRKFKYPFTFLFVLIFTLGFHFVRFFMPAASLSPCKTVHCLVSSTNVNADQQLPSRRNLKSRVEEDANVLENHQEHLQSASVSVYFSSRFALLAKMHEGSYLFNSYFPLDRHSSHDPLFLRNGALLI